MFCNRGAYSVTQPAALRVSRGTLAFSLTGRKNQNKMKNLLILIALLLTNFTFGQTSGGGKINLKVSFEKDILVEDIDVFYSSKNNSMFNEINYEIDTFSNSIIIKGDHEWWNAPVFPTFIFSYQQNDKIYMFYLASSSPPYIVYNFEKKIVFSFEVPNVHITNNNGTFELKFVGKGSDFINIYAVNELIKIKNEKQKLIEK